ncbi:MAG: YggT family protein [Chloroflexia bacterium]|nr:YggT family protein [Chloroflexia bacterium]
MDVLLTILIYILRLAGLVLLGRVLVSWVDPLMRTPVSQFLYRITEPVLAPIRRLLPGGSPLDFSPLILFVLIEVLIRVIASLY